MPAPLQSAFHHLGADRDAKGLVLREVAAGVEGDEEPTVRIDAEEDCDEEAKGFPKTGASVEGV